MDLGVILERSLEFSSGFPGRLYANKLLSDHSL